MTTAVPVVSGSPAAASTGEPRRRIRLRSHLANVEIQPQDVVSFPDGLPGYESTRAFVLLDSPDAAPLRILHSVDRPEPCFLAIDPVQVMPGYRCVLSAADRRRLGAEDEGRLVWLALVTVSDQGEIAANLRAPIVINPERMIGRQVLPNDGVYPLRHVIAST